MDMTGRASALAIRSTRGRHPRDIVIDSDRVGHNYTGHNHRSVINRLVTMMAAAGDVNSASALIAHERNRRAILRRQACALFDILADAVSWNVTDARICQRRTPAECASLSLWHANRTSLSSVSREPTSIGWAFGAGELRRERRH